MHFASNTRLPILASADSTAGTWTSASGSPGSILLVSSVVMPPVGRGGGSGCMEFQMK